MQSIMKWCVYKGVMGFPIGVARIDVIYDFSAQLKMSEHQSAEIEYWDKRYIEVYDRWEDALHDFCQCVGLPYSKSVESFLDRFPSCRSN
jgi:hypothetical protein